MGGSLNVTPRADSSCSSPVGLANPALYAAPSSDFDDVTSGNNSYEGVTGYAAGPGYDEASGLGAPQAGALLGALALADRAFVPRDAEPREVGDDRLSAREQSRGPDGTQGSRARSRGMVCQASPSGRGTYVRAGFR